MSDIYAWILANGVTLVAVWFAFEKLVNLLVGLTKTEADDEIWAKVRGVLGWVLNTRSAPSP